MSGELDRIAQLINITAETCARASAQAMKPLNGGLADTLGVKMGEVVKDNRAQIAAAMRELVDILMPAFRETRASNLEALSASIRESLERITVHTTFKQPPVQNNFAPEVNVSPEVRAILPELPAPVVNVRNDAPDFEPVGDAVIVLSSDIQDLAKQVQRQADAMERIANRSEREKTLEWRDGDGKLQYKGTLR